MEPARGDRTHWLIADWQGLMEPACGESCPLGQRGGRAVHGEDKIPGPDQNSFHISANPTKTGTEGGDFTGRYRPHVVEPQYTIADWDS